MSYETKKRLINGDYANSKNVIARCHLLAHRGYLTKNLAAKHKCIKKKCPFFEKMKPEYWQAKEKAYGVGRVLLGGFIWAQW